MLTAKQKIVKKILVTYVKRNFWKSYSYFMDI